jgi:hypothetical protein
MKAGVKEIRYTHEAPGIVTGVADVMLYDITPMKEDISFYQIEEMLEFALKNLPEIVIIKCQYCGQWVARKCACRYCGGTAE